MKRCTKCGDEKPPTDFRGDRSQKDGRYPQCKACERLWRQENAEYMADYHRRWQQENRDKTRGQDRRYRERKREDPEYWERRRANARRRDRERRAQDPDYRERRRANNRRYRERKRARLSDVPPETNRAGPRPASAAPGATSDAKRRAARD